VTRAAGRNESLFLIVYWGIVTGETSLVLDGRAEASGSHVAQGALIAKNGVRGRKRAAVVNVLPAKGVFADQPSQCDDRDRD